MDAHELSIVRLREEFASEAVPVADGVAEMRRMDGMLWVGGCGGVATAVGRAVSVLNISMANCVVWNE